MTGEDYARILQSLKKLQDWQQEVIRLEDEIEQVPELIARLEQETEEGAASVEQAEEELREEQKRNRQLESELEDAQEKLSHFKDQTLQVKTNEQLWALQKEIKFFQKKISDLETQVIESMELLDSERERLEAAQTEYSRLTKENREKVAGHERRLEEMQEDLARARKGLEEIRIEVPGEYLELFERIQQAKNGLAVAVVLDGICQACNFRIRPQVHMEVRNFKGIYNCDNCQRILFYEEEPPLENPAEMS